MAKGNEERNTANHEPTKERGSHQRATLDNLRLVYEVLKQNSTGGRCRMSVREIADLCGLPHSTTHRALQRLKADGIIHIEAARYVNEPDTIIIDPHGFGDPLIEVRSTMERVIEDLNWMYALLPTITKYGPEAERKAAQLDQLLAAVTGTTDLPGGAFAVVLDQSKLDPELADTLRKLGART